MESRIDISENESEIRVATGGYEWLRLVMGGNGWLWEVTGGYGWSKRVTGIKGGYGGTLNLTLALMCCAVFFLLYLVTF